MPVHESELFPHHLEALFGVVTRAVTTNKANRRDEVGLNAKGDRVKRFDRAAHQAVGAYLKSRFPCPITLLSEEGPAQSFGGGKPEFTMVLDPVDGSDNFARGITPVGMTMALIPAGLPIAVGAVQFALVGDLYTGGTWSAARGRGASCNGRPIRTRSVSRLEEALLSCELNHFAVPALLSDVLSRAHGVRASGCATAVLAMVADGRLDAHLDVRGRLTPENFLGPSLILTEAGGVITTPRGNPLPEVFSLTERHSILAAATLELHTILVQELKGRK